MPKGVNLTAYSGGEIEFILDEPVPKSCLLDHVDVMCCGLVMHTYAPISAHRDEGDQIKGGRVSYGSGWIIIVVHEF